MPLNLSVNRIIINTHDPEGLADFYLEVFGFKQVFHDAVERWYVFDSGPIEIAIHEMPDSQSRKFQNKICFQVDDIERAYADLKSRELLISDSISTFNGQKMFDITDPFGIDYQFIQDLWLSREMR